MVGKKIKFMVTDGRLKRGVILYRIDAEHVEVKAEDGQQFKCDVAAIYSDQAPPKRAASRSSSKVKEKDITHRGKKT